MIADQTLGRRAINLINPEARGRLNALFVGIFFIGGAIGAMLAGMAWARAGWSGACTVMLGLASVVFLLGFVQRASRP